MRSSSSTVALTSLVTSELSEDDYHRLFVSGTNFPAELYDGHLFGKESYYEELARAQKEEMDRQGFLFNIKILILFFHRREKAAEARRKAGDHRPREPAVVTNRKSKWDQGVSQFEQKMNQNF